MEGFSEGLLEKKKKKKKRFECDCLRRTLKVSVNNREQRKQWEQEMFSAENGPEYS